MKAGRVNGRSLTPPHSQRGVVLLIALIMLVAMTLAGIGMMRSVDTGSMIAGNLAFRHATSQASDAGLSTGFNVLMSAANSANSNDKNVLNFNGDLTQPCASGASATLCVGGVSNLPGYFATPTNPCEVTNQTTGTVTATVLGTDTVFNCTATQNTWWQNQNNWANAITMAPVTDPANGATIATVSYIIHRMCQSSGVAPSSSLDAARQLCQTYAQSATGCSKTQKLPCTSTSVFYRITARSVGARNTVSYTQTLALIGM